MSGGVQSPYDRGPLEEGNEHSRVSQVQNTTHSNAEPVGDKKRKKGGKGG